MAKQKYKQIQAGVAVSMGLVVAFSIVRQTYEVAMIGVVVGILVLIIASKQVEEVVRDERNALIQQKASTMTLSIITLGLVFGGIAVEELSYRGFESMRGYGSFMTYIAMGMMTIYSLFTWYYGRQMGD